MVYDKITQKEFDKLPQLDRIELRQKRDFIINNKINFGPFEFLLSMIKIMCFIILLSICLMNINIDSGYIILSLLSPISRVALLMFLLLLSFQIASHIFHLKKMKELYSQYFEIKTEVKKK